MSDAASDSERSSLLLAAISSITPSNKVDEKLLQGVEDVEYRVYPHKWYVLLTVCLLTVSNATLWISYAPLSLAVRLFYLNTTETTPESDIVQRCNQIFLAMNVLPGVVGIYVTDKYGIKPSTVVGTCLNMVGSSIRLISSIPSVPLPYRSPLLYLATVFIGSAVPFFLVLSPKVAAHWFSPQNRTFANVLSFIANPLGTVIGSVLPVQIVMSQETVTVESNDFILLNGVLVTVPIIAFAMSIFMQGEPPTPPSPACHITGTPGFLKGMAICFKSQTFYALTIVFSAAYTELWLFFFHANDILTEVGYSDSLSAYLTMTSCVVGVMSSLAAGVIVDRTKKFKEVIHLCILLLTISFIGLNIFLRHPPSSQWESFLLYIFAALLGSFAITIWPMCLEMAIEATFPVMEATSGGIVLIISSLLFFLRSLVTDELKKWNVFYRLDGTEGMPRMKSNHWFAIDFSCAILFITSIISIVCIRKEYKRSNFEKEAKKRSERSKEEE